MIEPTERTLWILVAVVVVGILGAALPMMGEAALALLVGLAISFVLDWALTQNPKTLSFERELEPRVVQGRVQKQTFVLQSDKSTVVEISDTRPVQAMANDETRVAEYVMNLDAEGAHTLSEDIVFQQRGEAEFGRVTLRTRGPLKLVRRRYRLPTTNKVQVVPDLAKVAIEAERILRGDAGAKARQQISRGRDFDSLREYQRGDDPRYIEWKASARSRTLVVKRMIPEQRQDVFVLAESARHCMGKNENARGGERRIDVLVGAALHLSAAALSKGDRVGAISFSDEVKGVVLPHAGRGHLRSLSDLLSQAQAQSVEPDFGKAVNALLQRQKKRAMVAFFTNISDLHSARDLIAAITRLRGRHLPVVFAMKDPALEKLLVAPDEKTLRNDSVEAFVPMAAKRMLSHRKSAINALTRAGARVVDVAPHEASALAVQHYRNIKNTGRL